MTADQRGSGRAKGWRTTIGLLVVAAAIWAGLVLVAGCGSPTAPKRSAPCRPQVVNADSVHVLTTCPDTGRPNVERAP